MAQEGAQEPFEQTSPGLHTNPQPPQFDGSEATATHTPLQSTSSEAQLPMLLPVVVLLLLLLLVFAMPPGPALLEDMSLLPPPAPPVPKSRRGGAQLVPRWPSISAEIVNPAISRWPMKRAYTRTAGRAITPFGRADKMGA